MVCLLIGSHLSLRSQAVSINDSISSILYSFLGCTPRFRTWPTPFHSLYYSSWLGDLKQIPKHHLHADDTQLYISFTHLSSLSMSFSPGWTWTNYFSIHEKPTFFSLAQTTSFQIFWSNKFISQQCQFLLASSLTLSCLSLIKSTLYPNLVIFISETPAEFVIFFLFLQPQLLQILLSPANLTILQFT